jgi:hypothetical protein
MTQFNARYSGQTFLFVIHSDVIVLEEQGPGRDRDRNKDRNRNRNRDGDRDI